MTKHASDRRVSPRHDQVQVHGIVAAQITPGANARLIDVSAGGVLVETNERLLPGASVEVHMTTRTERSSVRGHVLRCAVVRVRPSFVFYQGSSMCPRRPPHLPVRARPHPRGQALPRRCCDVAAFNRI
jgi:PilZ domain